MENYFLPVLTHMPLSDRKKDIQPINLVSIVSFTIFNVYGIIQSKAKLQRNHIFVNNIAIKMKIKTIKGNILPFLLI